MTPQEYRAARAQHPEAGALTVYRWSRIPKPHSLDWNDHGSESVGTATIDGWDIRATIAEDYEVDLADTYGTLTDEYQRGAFENPHWRVWHHGGHADRWSAHIKYRHDDVCSSRHDDDGAARWYISDAGDSLEELRDYYRKYLSRHEAHSRALADFRQRADEARRAYSDRYGQGRYAFAFVTATASLAGVEVSHASYGGYSWERDYNKPLDPQLDAIVDDAVREVLADAPHGVTDAAIAQETSAHQSMARATALRHAGAVS